MTIFDRGVPTLVGSVSPGGSLEFIPSSTFGNHISIIGVYIRCSNLQKESTSYYKRRQYYRVGFYQNLIGGFAGPPTWIVNARQYAGHYCINQTENEISFIYPDNIFMGDAPLEAEVSKVILPDGESTYGYLVDAGNVGVPVYDERYGGPDFEGTANAIVKRFVIKSKSRLWNTAEYADSIYLENISKAANIDLLASIIM